MRLHVLCAFVMMLATSFAGCIGDSDIEQITDEITEVLGCMDEAAINYDHNATVPSNLCLSMDQIIAAEEIFWSSWDADVVNNVTDPVGYRLMFSEISADGNETKSQRLDIQEVFSPDYYDREIWYTNSPEQSSRQTVFDNVVQVEKFSDGEWDNYSMNTTSTYEEFSNRLEHGPGISNDNATVLNNTAGDEEHAQTQGRTTGRTEGRVPPCPSVAGFPRYLGWKANSEGCKVVLKCEADGGVAGLVLTGDNSAQITCYTKGSGIAQPSGVIGFPPIDQSEFKYVEFQDVSSTGDGRTQTIYYFAKDYNTGTEIEVMGEMTEDGFKITEYCNVIQDSSGSIIDNYQESTDSLVWGISESNGSVISVEDNGSEIDRDILTISARIILLEVDGNDMRFEEYDYDEPVNARWSNNTVYDSTYLPVRAIPFYFEMIPDLDNNESENRSAEGKKGLNAVNVKVVIAGPSGPYGMEGDLSDYRLVISNCTLDNATTGVDGAIEADEDTSARSVDNNTLYWRNQTIYGSAGNSCTDIVEYDLASGVHLNGTKFMVNRSQGGGPSIIFDDADSSGTLSEGDRFEFSDNNTIFDGANMIRLFSISADEYSDGNINPSSEMSAVHEGAMNAIRNIRSVAPDDPPPAVELLTRDFIGIDSTDSES
jgi:hypothetical protein